jgi:CheY-like chemotaxis protein
MISEVLLQRYQAEASPLIKTLGSHRPLLDFLKQRAADQQVKSSDPLLSDRRLVELVERHPEIVPYLRQTSVPAAVDPKAVPQSLQPLLGANPDLMGLLTARPRLVQSIFRVDAAGEDRKEVENLTLYWSLVAKVEEFNERLAKGNRLPRFAIALNHRSGLREIDVTLGDGPPVMFGDALASLEAVLAEAFLGYSDDPIAHGYLSVPLEYTIQQRGSQKSFSTVGRDVLFSPLTMISYPLFRYALWLLSRRADIEVGRSLDSIRVLLDELDRRRPETRIRRHGHVLVLTPAAEDRSSSNVSLDMFLSDLGEKIASIFAGRLATEAGAVPPAYLAELYGDRDVQVERLREALVSHDYFACDEIVRTCTSERYLFNRHLLGKFVNEASRLAQGEQPVYELYAEHGKCEFLRRTPADNVTTALESLLAVFCAAAKARMARTLTILSDYDDATNREAIQHFVRVHAALGHERAFQLHRDFVASARDVPDFAGSPDRTSFDKHHPLTDLLRLVLQRRYEELTIILEVLASDDYALLNRHLRHLSEALAAMPAASTSAGLLPDPVLVQGASWPRITFDSAPALPLDEFCRCLALQLYGVLTGTTVVNVPSLWLSPALVTHSAVDNFLASLWGATFQSADTIRLVLSQMREDLLELLVQYRHQGRPEKSEIRDARLKIIVRPTRDVSVLRKQRTRVLLVDDAVDIVEMFGQFLTQCGCAIQTAYNGREALDVFRAATEPIDVVITDIRMPVMDGIELTREIKRVDPDVPVILCSGLVDVSAERAGADAAVSKPVAPDTLVELILSTLAQRYPERYAEVGI